MDSVRPNYKLIASSAFFLLPAIYGFHTKKYGFTTVTLITTICSINYWIYPESGMRRNIDLFVSKASAIIYFVYGYNNLSNPVIRVVGFTNGFMILTFYNISCILYQTKSNYWDYFHMLFHLSVAFGKLLALF